MHIKFCRVFCIVDKFLDSLILKSLNLKKLLIIVFFLNVLLKYLFSKIFDLNNFYIEEISSILTRLFLVVFILTYLYKVNKRRDVKFKFTNYFDYIISIIIILIIFQNFNNINLSYDFYVEQKKLILFLMSCLVTGFFEEFFFRYLIFENVLVKYNKLFIKSTLITSFIFGIFHFSNFIIGKYDIYSTLIQIEFAFLMGILFQTIYLLRNRDIILISVFHGLINFFGGFVSTFTSSNLSNGNQSFLNFLESQPTLLILSILILPICYYSLKKMQNLLPT